MRDKDEERTLQIRKALTTMHMVELAHNDDVGKVQIRIYAPIRLVEGDVCDQLIVSRHEIGVDLSIRKRPV